MTKRNGRVSLPTTTVELELDEPYVGVKIKCQTDVSLGLFLRFSELEDAESKEIADTIRQFGDHVLVDTNVDIDGKPMTPDGDGLLDMPMPFIKMLLEKWADAVRKDAPLEEEVSAS